MAKRRIGPARGAKARRAGKLTWDLESIFPGGSASKEFKAFHAALSRDLGRAMAALGKLPRGSAPRSLKRWADFILFFQGIAERLSHAGSFAYCLVAQDVNDARAMALLEEISAMEASWEIVKTGIEEYAMSLKDAAWKKIVGDKRLEEVSFYLNEMRRIARLKMDPARERLAAELSTNGYHAWNRIYTKIAGDLRAEFPEDGKKIELSMGQLSNRMSSPDRAIRKQAFEKLSSSWETVEALTAMELNSMAGFRLSLYKERGWDSTLAEALLAGRMKRETVDAMWEEVARGRSRVAQYVAAKKRLLGIDSFRWYDMMAPLGDVEQVYTYDEACDFVVRHLSSFSKDLGTFSRMAIDRRWIEAEDRPGKMGGGFCTGFHVSKESRIFMTFSGNYNEMMTLAHELGHAYHGRVLSNRGFFGRNYPMNLAETASTFNEMLVTDAALEAAESDSDRLRLLDKKLQEELAMMCDIRCRYIFDTLFYKERKKGPVMKERLRELMVKAQKEAFGNILAEDGFHPLFWASKMHFSETSVPFYNFPYTFGHLFAGGIYDKAKREGRAFAAAYRALLADTGSMTTEGVAKKHLGVDLTRPTFWRNAVDRALADVGAFVKLAKEARG
jgi:oligoendopeptidase F